MKTWEGYYDTFEKPVIVKYKSGYPAFLQLQSLQEHIENAAGWGGDPNNFTFTEYETARIYEYNGIGRFTAEIYFSKKYMAWQRDEVHRSKGRAWRKAKQPFKFIAEWFIITDF
jgi:hypothetical protein